MFDFDGVIVDSLDVFSTAFIDACAAVGVPGFATPDDLLAVMEDNFYAGMRARGVDDDARRGGAPPARRGADPRAALAQAVPADPAGARGPGGRRAPSSSSPRVPPRWSRGGCARTSVHGVAEVAGAETARSKVEKIHALLARFPGQEVYWYVGDTAGDIREAREAGVTPLGVAWGWHEPEMLIAAGAERIAASPAELLDDRRAGAHERLLRRRLTAARRAGVSRRGPSARADAPPPPRGSRRRRGATTPAPHAADLRARPPPSPTNARRRPSHAAQMQRRRARRTSQTSGATKQGRASGDGGDAPVQHGRRPRSAPARRRGTRPRSPGRGTSSPARTCLAPPAGSADVRVRSAPSPRRRAPRSP